MIAGAHNTATAQAVIDAARKLMRHVETEIIVDRETGKAYLYMKTDDYDCDFSIAFEESEDDLPDTIPGCLAVLSGALEAHDEATTEPD